MKPLNALKTQKLKEKTMYFTSVSSVSSVVILGGIDGKRET